MAASPAGIESVEAALRRCGRRRRRLVRGARVIVVAARDGSQQERGRRTRSEVRVRRMARSSQVVCDSLDAAARRSVAWNFVVRCATERPAAASRERVEARPLHAVGRIAGGMDDDFTGFYRDAYPGAVRLAWLLTHDHAAAEDVVQDAFVRLRPRLGDGRTPHRLPADRHRERMPRPRPVGRSRRCRVASPPGGDRGVVDGQAVRAARRDRPRCPTSNERCSCCATGPTCARKRSPRSSACGRRPSGPSLAGTGTAEEGAPR